MAFFRASNEAYMLLPPAPRRSRTPRRIEADLIICKDTEHPLALSLGQTSTIYPSSKRSTLNGTLPALAIPPASPIRTSPRELYLPQHNLILPVLPPTSPALHRATYILATARTTHNYMRIDPGSRHLPLQLRPNPHRLSPDNPLCALLRARYLACYERREVDDAEAELQMYFARDGSEEARERGLYGSRRAVERWVVATARYTLTKDKLHEGGWDTGSAEDDGSDTDAESWLGTDENGDVDEHECECTYDYVCLICVREWREMREHMSEWKEDDCNRWRRGDVGSYEPDRRRMGIDKELRRSDVGIYEPDRRRMGIDKQWRQSGAESYEPNRRRMGMDIAR